MGSVCTPVLTRSGRLASPLACFKKKKQEKQKSHTAQSAMKTLNSCTGMLLAVDSSSGCCFLGHPKKTKYEWLGCSPFEGCVPLPTVSSASLTLTPSLRQNIARRSKVRAEHLQRILHISSLHLPAAIHCKSITCALAAELGQK
jgi:hypothetical protein